MPDHFDVIFTDFDTTPKSTKADQLLDYEHPLVQSAVRWVRQTRYSKDDDHRLAVRLVDDMAQPDLIVTFLATIRAGDNTQMEQLVAVQVLADRTIIEKDALPLLREDGRGNVPPPLIPRLFGAWWEEALEAGKQAAEQRANRWRSSVQQQRFAEQGELKRQFDVWAQATREAITAGYDVQQQLLPGVQNSIPPTVQRRLKEHRKEVDDYAAFLERRLQFDPAGVEPLGVLLRVPTREAR